MIIILFTVLEIIIQFIKYFQFEGLLLPILKKTLQDGAHVTYRVTDVSSSSICTSHIAAQKRIQTYVLYYLSNCAYKRAVCIRVCDALTSTPVCVCVFELFRNTLPPHNEHEPEHNEHEQNGGMSAVAGWRSCGAEAHSYFSVVENVIKVSNYEREPARSLTRHVRQ